MHRFFKPVFLYSIIATLLFITTPAEAAKQPGPHPPINTEISADELQQWWQALPEQEQQLIRQRHDVDFTGLPMETQQKIKHRWQRFQQMSPEEQQRVKERFGRWQEMDPAERKKLRRSFRNFKQLPPEQQQELRRELHELRELELTHEQREERRKEIKQRYFPKDTTAPDPSR